MVTARIRKMSICSFLGDIYMKIATAVAAAVVSNVVPIPTKSEFFKR